MFGQGLNFGGLIGASGPFDADFLVIAGGGGGGGVGGAGGGGGLRTSYGSTTGGGGGSETQLTLVAATNYTVTIGGGGVASSGGSPNYDGSNGANGNNSIFATITSTGGGGGGSSSNNAPASGGSGGGSRFGTPGSATTSPVIQGFGGGNAASAGLTNTIGGGGGGASQAGNTTGNNGGNGLASLITGSSVTYAGGGGGGGNIGGSTPYDIGLGGSGGGGNGGYNNGTTNTGGGGGGGSWTNNSNYNTQKGGAGGSGVVILRYPTSKVSSYAVTGTLDTTEGASYPIANSAFYKLNNNVIDSSGNGYNGNASNVTYASGKFGKAAVFASNGNINTNIPASFFNTNTWSISLWIKPTGTAFKYFLGNGNTGINNGFAMGMYGDGSRFDFITRNSSTTVGRYQGGTPIPGVWTNVVIINNGNSYSFYQDNALMTNYGSFTQPASGGSYSSSNSFVLGRAGAMTAEQFAGKFDQVRIFSSVLSTANLTALYNEGTNEVLESTDGTDSILEFTGGSGDITFS